MSVVLSVRGLRKRYGEVAALRGLDLEVNAGEVFGFLGPNGAGKTTFTKCVTGFVRPSGGEVTVCGIDALKHPTRVAHHVGLVPDQYDFYTNLTGRQHLDFYGRLMGMDNERRKRRIDEVLDIVKMDERADTRVKGYSHGMKQRICIAQAILHEPDLIFFDEPTNGLDPQGAYELRQMMRDLTKDGATVFLNSHLLTEVQEVCDRVAIVQKGALRTVGRVADLRRSIGGSQVEVRLSKVPTTIATTVQDAVGVKPRIQGNTLHIELEEGRVPDLVEALVKAKARVIAVNPVMASLEDVFLELTEGGAK